MSQNLKSKDAIVFTQFAIYELHSFKITQYKVLNKVLNKVYIKYTPTHGLWVASRVGGK